MKQRMTPSPGIVRTLYDGHLQPRLFARWNQPLKRSPTPPGFAEIVGDYFPVLHWRGGFCWPPAIRK